MSTRIKFDDPLLEQSCVFADAMHAAHQSVCKALRLGQIIDAQQGCNVEHQVTFDFGYFRPAGIESYRGYYCDLALSYDDETPASVRSVLELLTDADGKIFTGYKGGDYRMDRDTPVWVANYGQSPGVAVTGVDDIDWKVIIRTALIDT